MKELPHFLKRCLPRVATLCLLTPLLLLTSCSSTKNRNTASTSEYPSDGGYHPYPGGGASGSSSHYQEYTPSGSGNAPSYQPQSDSGSDADNAPPPTKKKKKKKPSSDSDSVASSSSHKSSTSSSTHSKTTSSGSYRTHIVKSGDTLYSLAKRYHTSVATLKRINNRTSDVLRDGEKIKIPAAKKSSS